MELSEDSSISEFDRKDEESAMNSSNDSDEYFYENSYMSKDKNTIG